LQPVNNTFFFGVILLYFDISSGYTIFLKKYE
jgi:hypothetical protein